MDQHHSLLRFKILYTHQKLKKTKTWQDGYLDYKTNNKKATLSSEDHKILDTVFLKIDDVYEDAELESDKYLIQVENEVTTEDNCYKKFEERSSIKENISGNGKIQKNEKKERKTLKPYFRPPSMVKKCSMKIEDTNAPMHDIHNNSSNIKQSFNRIDSLSKEVYTSHHSSSPGVSLQHQHFNNIEYNRVNIPERKPSCDQITNRPFSSYLPTPEENLRSFNSNSVVLDHESESESGSKRTITDMLALFDEDHQNDDTNNKQIYLTNVQRKSEKIFESNMKDFKTHETHGQQSFNKNIKTSKLESDESNLSDCSGSTDCKIVDFQDVYYSFNQTQKIPSNTFANHQQYQQHQQQKQQLQQVFADFQSTEEEDERKSSFNLWMDDEQTKKNGSIVHHGSNDCDSSDVHYLERNDHADKQCLSFKRKSLALKNGVIHATQTPFRTPLSSSFSKVISSNMALHGSHSTVKPSSSFQAPYLSKSHYSQSPLTHSSLYKFPSKEECFRNPQQPQRDMKIPISYDSVTEYKRIFKKALYEHLNILHYELAVRYHRALNSVDISAIENSAETSVQTKNEGPCCKHGKQATMRTVRKDGKNKGRMFYACAENGDKSCNYFAWLDSVKSGVKSNDGNKSEPRRTLIKDFRSLTNFINGHNIQLYCGVKIARKSFGFSNNRRGRVRGTSETVGKKKLFIVLPNKKPSSFYSKDDIWIISKHLDFPQSAASTFIARSVFYGPNSACEVEISSLASYSMSNWPNGELCYAIHAFNATTELTCIENLDSYVNNVDIPILPSLLDNTAFNLTRQAAVQYSQNRFSLFCLPLQDVLNVVRTFSDTYSLNTDQESALQNIAYSFVTGKSDKVVLIHGVFGAGKSFLLSVVVLFLLQLFEIIETRHELHYKLKLVIASTTNVAVDRVLSCLLDHGHEEFLRVGSLKKIAKPILPFSLHADEHENQEMKELNDILNSELSDTEKEYVKKAIELHKKGVNRKRLDDVRVIGVTCASSVFPLLQKRTFHVHLLDECSQMIEPLTMVPLARFRCQRLVLVGDPNQLSPTIQGPESTHSEGLEMTMFERLEKMNCSKVTLRYQYRCHPAISAICNTMFYNEQLLNGVTSEDRPRLIEWLPSISIVDVQGEEKCGPDGSYYNQKEAEFIVKLVNDILQTGIESIQIGVITQYKAQVFKIQSLLCEHNTKFTATELKGIQISTVDAFQGAEKDIILLSCVRSRFIGFINCPRRTNVALSRARHHLVIAGNLRLLRSDKLWNSVFSAAQSQEAYFTTGAKYFIKTNMEVC